MELANLLTALGLKKSATFDDALRAIERLSAEVEELSGESGEVTTLKEKLAAANGKVAELEAKLATQSEEQRRAECDAFIDKLAAEHIIKADGARAKLIRKHFMAGAREYVDELVASYRESAPLGKLGKRQSAPDPEVNKRAGKRASASDDSDDDKLDYRAIFNGLEPELKDALGPSAASNPEAFFRCNKTFVADLGIDLG